MRIALCLQIKRLATCDLLCRPLRQQMRLFAVGLKQRALGEIVHFGLDPTRFEEWFLLDREDCLRGT